MIMKKKFTFLKYFSLLSLAVVSSMCTMDEVLEESYSPLRTYGANDDKVPVAINVSVDDAAEASTRAVSTLNAAAFSEPYQNASIWYKRFNSSDVAESETFTANNTFAASYESSTNKLTPSTPIYFMPGGLKVQMYGWYPANGGNTAFTIQSNQTTNASYVQSDLMLADQADCTRALNGSNEWVVTNAALTFRHVMSKIILNVTLQSGVTVNTITLKNVKPTVNINTTTTTSLALGEATGEAGDVVVYSSAVQGAPSLSSAIAAIIPPQTIGVGAFLVVNATQGGNTGNITYNLSVAKAFASSNHYAVNINVDASLIGQTVTIGDWTEGGELTLPVANQITVTSGGSQVKDLTNDETPDAIVISNIKNTTGFNVAKEEGNTSSITWEITGSTAETRSVNFTVPANTTPGVYNFIATDPGTPAYRASTATITIAVGSNVATIEAKLDVVNTNLTSIDSKIADLLATNQNILDKLDDIYVLLTLANTADKVWTLTEVKAHPAPYFIGQYIHDDGTVNTTASEAVAKIAYLGNGDVSTANYYHNGLAIALTDAKNPVTGSGTTFEWCKGGTSQTTLSGSQTAESNIMNIYDHEAHLNGLELTTALIAKNVADDTETTEVDETVNYQAAMAAKNYNVTKPSGTSDWFLPSLAQWDLMITTLVPKQSVDYKNGSPSTTSTIYGAHIPRWDFRNNTYLRSNVNSVVTGLNFADYYWSSTEGDGTGAWLVSFRTGYVDNASKSHTTISVRPVFAF